MSFYKSSYSKKEHPTLLKNPVYDFFLNTNFGELFKFNWQNGIYE